MSAYDSELDLQRPPSPGVAAVLSVLIPTVVLLYTRLSIILPLFEEIPVVLP